MKNTQLSIVLLILLVGFPQISETIYSPILPSLTFAYATSVQMVQQTLMIYFIGFALGTVLWGRLSDIYGRRVGLLIGLSIYALGSLACCYSPTVLWLLVSRLIQGTGAACGSVVTQAILRESYTGDAKLKAFSTISGALAFTPAIGPVLGGYLQETYGYQAVFHCLIIMGILLLIATYYRLPETNQHKHAQYEIKKVAWQMMIDAWIWRFAVLIASINGIIFGFYLEGPFVFIDQLNLSASSFGKLCICIAGASFGGAILSKRLVKILHPFLMIKLGALVIFSGGCSWLAMSFFNLESYYLISGLIVSLVLIFAGIGLALPYCLSLALEQYQHVLGTAGALLGLLYYVILSFLMVIMSLLHNQTLYPFSIFVLSLTGIMIMLAPGLKHRIFCTK